MAKKDKIKLYDVFDVSTGEWEQATTLGDVDKERLSFSECFEFYTAERDIARKLLTDRLIKAQKELIEDSKWEYGLSTYTRIVLSTLLYMYILHNTYV